MTRINPSYALACGLAIVLGCATNAAHAQDLSWYLSAKAGLSRADFADDFQASLDLAGARFDTDKQDTAAQLGVGLQLNPNFAVELHYGQLGRFDLRANAALPPIQVDAELELSALSLDLLGIYPITDVLAVYGKIGAARWDIAADVVASERESLLSSVRTDEQDISVKFGLGARYALNEQWQLGLDVEQFKVGKDDFESTQARTASVNVIFKF
jgi:OmpA-OmpF porin, OOP family